MEHDNFYFVEMYGNVKVECLICKVKKSLQEMFTFYLAMWQKTKVAEVGSGSSNNVAVSLWQQ